MSPQRETIYHVVDMLKAKHPAKLWLLINNYMEQEEKELKDPFTDEGTTVRVHTVKEDSICTSCEG